MKLTLHFNVCSKETSNPDINWDTLGFKPVTTDYMYVMKCSRYGVFSEGELQPFGNIELNPASGVLNYGQVCVIFYLLLRFHMFIQYIS